MRILAHLTLQFLYEYILVLSFLSSSFCSSLSPPFYLALSLSLALFLASSNPESIESNSNYKNQQISIIQLELRKSIHQYDHRTTRRTQESRRRRRGRRMREEVMFRDNGIRI